MIECAVRQILKQDLMQGIHCNWVVDWVDLKSARVAMRDTVQPGR